MKKKLLALSVLAAISTQAHAFEFDTSGDWDIRWDNTIKANVVSRVAKQDKDVYTARRGADWFIADDSDLAVDRGSLGLVSTRLDVLSEFDVIYRQNFGFRISGSGWYDYMYEDSDHPSDRRSTWGSPSVDPGEYTDAAESLHYFGGELLDAFVFGNWDIGETSLGVRAGRHTIYWGNSLLADGAITGIGGAMAPMDFAKALSVPGTEAKELFMPTAKLSSVWQLSENLTLNAYYSFEHMRYRVPETGTYFSPAEGLTSESEFTTVIPGDPFRVGLRSQNDKTESDEWGFNLQYWIDAWSLETSFIYLNYVDKNVHGLHAAFDIGQLAAVQAQQGDPLSTALLATWQAGCAAGALEPCPNPPELDADAGTIAVGRSRWLFKDDIDLFAVSLAKEIFGVSVGADIVFRQDAPLAPDLANSLNRFYGAPEPLAETIEGATGMGFIPGGYDRYDSDRYLAAVGDVWSVVINGLGLLNENALWEGGMYIVEATFQMLDDCTDNCELLDRRVSENRVVSTIGGIFKPTWFQVRPGWDLSAPMSLAYTIDGEKSPFTFSGDEERGSASVGLQLDIRETWTFNTAYNMNFGPVLAGTPGLLKDRDNISFTLKRTF